MNKLLIATTALLAMSAATGFAQSRDANLTVFGFRNVGPSMTQPAPRNDGLTVFGFHNGNYGQPMTDVASTARVHAG